MSMSLISAFFQVSKHKYRLKRTKNKEKGTQMKKLTRPQFVLFGFVYSSFNSLFRLLNSPVLVE